MYIFVYIFCTHLLHVLIVNFCRCYLLGRLRDANDRQVDSKLFLEDEKEVVEEVEEEDSGDEREDEIQTEKSKFMFLLLLGYFCV